MATAAVQPQTGDIDQLCINTIRTLVDGRSPESEFRAIPAPRWPWRPSSTTCGRSICGSIPSDPIWPNRDRFVLSVGHASMLLYSTLHLAGVKAVNPQYEQLGEVSVTLDDIRNFRQLDSKCPGHPEYRWTSGIETTTGPLGQGVATSVGMALAAQVDGGPFQPARLRDVRLRRLRASAATAA